VTNIALDSATNQATNSIATSGKSSASSGTAVSTHQETMVPLSALASYAPGTTPVSVNHENGQLASTISFNLPAGVALGTAAAEIQKTMSNLDVPVSIHGSFAGTAAAFKSSVGTEPLLILAALAAVYIVLGILYESIVHPITIISTIPSAGIGALLLLLLLNIPLTIIALIGVILLIGIVKKNAILMIDFALQLERGQNIPPEEAIFQAAVLRFRPIMMTTFAAILGALPLAIGLGQGASLRQPLGITIIGGLIVSQALTLYTTPVVYLFLDRLGGRGKVAPRSGSIVEAL
jgi:multidrug efflux pump